MELSFRIDGRPVPNARARRGAAGRWYTPARTASYRKLVQWSAAAALAVRAGGGPLRARWPLDATYAVEVIATPPDHRRMDADNVAKGCLDALIGLLWKDDSSVKKLTVLMREPSKARAGVSLRVEVLRD